jgi:N6-L-threonylcarbamoyladenine synthase
LSRNDSETLGFEEIAVRVGYYQPDGVDAIVMRLDLPRAARSAGTSRGEDLSGSAPVLGIETSCDETIGIVQGHDHARQRDLLLDGRACPLWRCRAEIAARAHLEALGPAAAHGASEAGVTLAELDAIAVTSGPGLSGALMVGVGAAKARSPSPSINRSTPSITSWGMWATGTRRRNRHPTSTIALLVSGGHTSAPARARPDRRRRAARAETIDDAAGGAFDKVARLLRFAYPGGPQIDRGGGGW